MRVCCFFERFFLRFVPLPSDASAAAAAFISLSAAAVAFIRNDVRSRSSPHFVTAKIDSPVGDLSGAAASCQGDGGET